MKQALYLDKARKNNHVLTTRLAFVLGLTVFQFSNLTFAIPSQIMFVTPVYASSNNNEDDESNQDDSTGNNNNDFSDEQNQQQESENDESSEEITLEQENQCSSEMIQEPSYVDGNCCHLPCPQVGRQTEIIHEDCPQPKQQQLQGEQQQQPSETSNNLNDPVTNENNPDTNIGFLDSGAIDKDTLKGKDITSDSIEPAEIKLIIQSQDIPKYFGEEKANEIGQTISFCVETVTPGGNTIFADPHCLSGLNVTQRLHVEPGDINIDIQHSPQIHIDSEPKYCSIDHLEPKQIKPCLIIFKPNSIPADVIPKPNSNFGKSMIGP